MNAVEDNPFTAGGERLAAELPRPEAILVISAHWYARGTRVSVAPEPKTIHDMGGFPDELYRIAYRAKGAPGIAREAAALVPRGAAIDHSRGLDHGAWVPLMRMYPAADIPVFQMSVDGEAAADVHFEIGRSLRPLRDRGVMILGSGNVVHDLSEISWDMPGGYPWADEFDRYVRDRVLGRSFDDVIQYERAGQCSRRAFSTPDHFFPLLSVLGASREDDRVEALNDARMMGSLSMTSYAFS